MACKCNISSESTTIKFIRGTSVTVVFKFNVSDLSTFKGVKFAIRKNYQTDPIIEKTITSLSGDSVTVVLNLNDTGLFTDALFQNGKNSVQYIWGLDLIVNDNTPPQIINIFPKTGEAAPLCIIYKNVVEEE